MVSSSWSVVGLAGKVKCRSRLLRRAAVSSMASLVWRVSAWEELASLEEDMVTMKSYISEANEYKGESGWEGGQVGAIRFGRCGWDGMAARYVCATFWGSQKDTANDIKITDTKRWSGNASKTDDSFG